LAARLREAARTVCHRVSWRVSLAVMAYALLLFVPLSIALRYLVDAAPGWVFLTGAAAIAVLADWLRRATEQLAERAGSTIGGLLNVSFGNTAELVLALFILSRAQTRVVQAQITGWSAPASRCETVAAGCRSQSERRPRQRGASKMRRTYSSVYGFDCVE
jgi:hypothetical protein